MSNNKKPTKHEALLWSIALPGFGQFLNRRYYKGSIFIILEFLVNVFANFNLAIIYSFTGEIQKAINVTNFQWLMFYPCLYMFAMWDAYREAEGETNSYSYLPFVFGAFFVTIGLIYSTKLKIMGVLLGPVILPILFLLPGLTVGLIIYYILLTTKGKRK
ncbi:hypothetical protein KDJ21_017910 [Metabacillus litoralis]|uniref:hypothetical protein n=1 Tax=Metabacillus litoralis TaxID=152268 RepID=UPI001B9C34BB|nr:hypothetical protein [Metabacillus litoralis]MCM3409737.1 hypothetical protein [Metabacillus litoralis]UHA58696.1 hypothetical protein KDJ21_017910 [Metabacillus litoralis]